MFLVNKPQDASTIFRALINKAEHAKNRTDARLQKFNHHMDRIKIIQRSLEAVPTVKWREYFSHRNFGTEALPDTILERGCNHTRHFSQEAVSLIDVLLQESCHALHHSNHVLRHLNIQAKNTCLRDFVAAKREEVERDMENLRNFLTTVVQVASRPLPPGAELDIPRSDAYIVDGYDVPTTFNTLIGGWNPRSYLNPAVVFFGTQWRKWFRSPLRTSTSITVPQSCVFIGSIFRVRYLEFREKWREVSIGNPFMASHRSR